MKDNNVNGKIHCKKWGKKKQLSMCSYAIEKTCVKL